MTMYQMLRLQSSVNNTDMQGRYIKCTISIC